MKVYMFFIWLFCLLPVSSFAKIGFGAGVDVNPNAARLSIRNWFSKYSGVEFGFGPTAKFEDFRFDDMSIQVKYMKGVRYGRFSRTYLGVIARYTLIKDPFFDKDMPSGGIFGGKEWYLGRYRNQGIALEAGVMYGRVKGNQLKFESGIQVEQFYKEFPVFMGFSYKYYF
ncbi:hypothetical protein MNBD_BACTEROID01-2307 [hydrothermal vent metagenome]|uniref:Outer membrane protein beta-barrel domain-containing protein n=1 Tax=hydrothermal vent metagenome TaxID=652676 RepID=A0A3B0TSR8_9ZZZZ